MLDETSLEERKRRYIETVEAAVNAPEQSWWQYPGPSYRRVSDYAQQSPQHMDTSHPALFKVARKTWLIGGVITIVAGMLLYIIGDGSFGFSQVLLLAVILLVILPWLLDNKPNIVISREGIWLYKDDRNILWENIVLVQIKEVHGETPHYFFIVHYYAENTDELCSVEVDLDGMVSPDLLASTVEQFRNSKTKTSVETEV